MKLYITRHGETEWNKEGKMQGWQNSNLTEKGIANAKKLGEHLSQISFDRIYCSPLGRAVDTAKYIRGDRDTEILLMDALKEMGFGTWEGMEHEVIEEQYQTQRNHFWNKPQLYEPIDGESFEQLFHRVKAALDEVIANADGENFLIVSHAVTIKAIYAILRDTPLADLWGPPFLYDTCLTILEVIDNDIKFILEADVSHLNEL